VGTGKGKKTLEALHQVRIIIVWLTPYAIYIYIYIYIYTSMQLISICYMASWLTVWLTIDPNSMLICHHSSAAYDSHWYDLDSNEMAPRC
jgi:hypothetical protein